MKGNFQQLVIESERYCGQTSSWRGGDFAADCRQVGAGLRNGRRLTLDLATGVENCRMVAVAEQTADVGKGLAAIMPEQVHSDMAGCRDAFTATRSA